MLTNLRIQVFWETFSKQKLIDVTVTSSPFYQLLYVKYLKHLYWIRLLSFPGRNYSTLNLRWLFYDKIRLQHAEEIMTKIPTSASILVRYLKGVKNEPYINRNIFYRIFLSRCFINQTYSCSSIFGYSHLCNDSFFCLRYSQLHPKNFRCEISCT